MVRPASIVKFNIPRDIFFTFADKFAIADSDWHFVAFSFDARKSVGYVILDEKVRHLNQVKLKLK